MGGSGGRGRGGGGGRALLSLWSLMVSSGPLEQHGPMRDQPIQQEVPHYPPNARTGDVMRYRWAERAASKSAYQA